MSRDRIVFYGVLLLAGPVFMADLVSAIARALS